MENGKYIVAVDLGSSDVVVALGSVSDSGKINIEGVEIRPSQGVVQGEVKNVELAAQSLKEAVSAIEERFGITVNEAFTGISGSHIKCAKHPYYVYVASKDGEIFDEDVRKLNESMRNVQAPEGYKLMHIIPQHYIVNDDEEVANPVGMFGKTLGSTFNLIIGEKVILSRLDKALQKVGIKQAGLFINALATAEAVTFPDEKELGVAVVDIGAGTTDLCIYQDGIVRYVGIIPLGSDAINKDIRSYGIMERYVEELKVKYGCAISSVVDEEKLVKVPGRTPHDHKEISFKNLASIIEARITDIVEYVNEEIKSSGYDGKLSAGLILTGGCAMTKEIKELFEQKTGLDVRIASPDILVTEESKEIAADPRLATAVGILYQGLQSGTGTKITPGTTSGTARTYQNQTVGSEIFNPVKRQPAAEIKRTEPPVETAPEVEKPKKEKKPKDKDKKGFMQKIKERIEKTFDLDVLDDMDV